MARYQHLPNYKETAKWYRKAVEQGYVHAQYNLRHIYAKGQDRADDKTMIR